MIEFKITSTQLISEEDINDIMTTALEGGITHWCGRVKINYDKHNNIIGIPENKRVDVNYASDVIGYGGSLTLYDIEKEDGPWVLTREKFIEGIKLEMKRSDIWSITDLVENHDAETADCIVQYALFGEVVYG